MNNKPWRILFIFIFTDLSYAVFLCGFTNPSIIINVHLIVLWIVVLFIIGIQSVWVTIFFFIVIKLNQWSCDFVRFTNTRHLLSNKNKVSIKFDFHSSMHFVHVNKSSIDKNYLEYQDMWKFDNFWGNICQPTLKNIKTVGLKILPIRITFYN